MARASFSAFFPLVLAGACTGKSEDRGRTGLAAQADADAPQTVFEVIGDQGYVLPDDAPDELLKVPSKYYAGQTVSLRQGRVLSAWTTTDSADGAPSVMVYRCAPDATGRYRWAGAPAASLAPLGVDLTELPDLLPFTATHTLVGASDELGFTVEGPVRVLRVAPLPSRSELDGVEEATLPSDDDGALPIARLHKTQGRRFGLYQPGSVELADYVLRLHTVGGAGPGAGTTCTPGAPQQRVPFSAEYWFVHVNFIPIEEHHHEATDG